MYPVHPMQRVGTRRKRVRYKPMKTGQDPSNKHATGSIPWIRSKRLIPHAGGHTTASSTRRNPDLMCDEDGATCSALPLLRRSGASPHHQRPLILPPTLTRFAKSPSTPAESSCECTEEAIRRSGPDATPVLCPSRGGGLRSYEHTTNVNLAAEGVTRTSPAHPCFGTGRRANTFRDVQY
jgi:hypothetical protein